MKKIIKFLSLALCLTFVITSISPNQHSTNSTNPTIYLTSSIDETNDLKISN